MVTVVCGVVTVTVAVAVTETPSVPLTVSVYVVVLVGVTLTLPDETGLTAPTPLSMLADDALVVAQDKVEDEPLVMLAGLADKAPIGF